MIRSICLVTPSYPPEQRSDATARTFHALARGFVELGVAVHVIARDTRNEPSRTVLDDVVVHRIPSMTADPDSAPELDRSLWAFSVAEHYRELERQVGFDIVLAVDHYGGAMKLLPGTHAALVVQLIGGIALDATKAGTASQTIAATIELEAMRRADLVIAPSHGTAHRVGALLGCGVMALPPAFLAPPFAVSPPRDLERPLELLFHGPLSSGSGAEAAIEILGQLKQTGRAARLSLVAEELSIPANRFRREILLGQMDRLGLDWSEVRFCSAPPSSMAHYLREADVLLAPHPRTTLDLSPLEALASGCHVLVDASDPATSWFETSPAVHTVSFGTTDSISEAVCVLQQLTPAHAAAGPARVSGLLDPTRVAERYLTAFEELPRRARLDRRLRQAARPRPRIGVVVTADADLAATRRCLESLLEHTTIPLAAVVVGQATLTADLVSSFADPRISFVAAPPGESCSAAMNRGLADVRGDVDFICFLDARCELLAEWWSPFCAALSDEQVAIASDRGASLDWTERGPALAALSGSEKQCCAVAIGDLVILRASALDRVGVLDERITNAWQIDLALRVARTGEKIVQVANQPVLQLDRVDRAVEDELPLADAEVLALKSARLALATSTPFLVLADAEEAASDPRLLSTWQAAFTKDDAAALVLFGIGLDPLDYELRLGIAAERAGFDLEGGPRLIALLPPTASDDEKYVIADEVFAVLSSSPPQGACSHLAAYRPDQRRELRQHAARAWAARPTEVERDAENVTSLAS